MHTITLKSNKPVVAISIDEYESMKETIELLSTNPHLLEELQKERKKIDKGNFISLNEFKKNYKVK